MHTSVNQSLIKEYENWRRSQYFFELIKKSGLVNELEDPKIEAGLENALMFQVNTTSKNPNVNLLTSEFISFGFNCVNVELNAKDLEHFVELATTKISRLEEHLSNLEIGINKHYFFVENFQLRINQYTKKAFDFLMKDKTEKIALEILLSSALRYASIFAKTRHIGPPQETYDYFYKWGVRNEAFASPFNARLLGKEKASFFSLFEDTDGDFGSQGSLFEINSPENYDGDWCFDPPFIEELMEKAVEKINEWKNSNPNINFILIVPDWFTPQLNFDEKVLLKENVHYCEGLDGVKRPLPVDVGIYLIGDLEDFSAEKIKTSYSLN